MIFTVIVPVYNGQKYISQCLLTVQKQTFSGWECIFIDDGSSDNTLHKLQLYSSKDRRIKVIHQENRGAAQARVTGIKAATGEYLLFLDVDDTLEANALRDISDVIQHSHETDIVVFGLNIIKNHRVKKKIPEPYHDSVSYLRSVLTGKNGWEMCGKAYKRTLFSTMPEVADNVRIGEDAVFFIQLVLKSKHIAFLEDAYYNYIMQEGSASKKHSDKLAEETMDAAFFIERKLMLADCYKQIEDVIPVMTLLFFSNSTRRGRLKKGSFYSQKISQSLSLSTLCRLPWYKSLNVLVRYFQMKF